MVVAQDRFDRQASSRVRPRARRRWVYGLAAAGILLIAVLGVVLLRPGKPAAGPAKPAPSLTVTVAVPHRVSWADQLETSGAIAPWQEASIGAQIGGYQLSDVRVNVGDQVKKGEILARFDQGLLRADEAQLAANYDQAAQNEKRALALQQSGAMAEQNVLAAVTASKTALAALESKRLQLRYADVVAPDDGRVARVDDLQVGDFVNPGASVFSLMSSLHIWIEANFRETDLTHMHPGQEAVISVDAFPDRIFNAHVVSMSPGTGADFAVLPPENATGNWVKVVQRLPVSLELDIIDADQALYSGISVTVRVDTGCRRSWRHQWQAACATGAAR